MAMSLRGVTVHLPQYHIERLFIPERYVQRNVEQGSCAISLYPGWQYSYVPINWMFSQEYGFVNFIIRSLGGTALEWSLNPRLATFVIAFASVWASIGFNMILYIGGINSISNDLYEAATIDGASGVQAFFRITVPMLAPTTFMVVLLSTVNLLKEYALVQGITQGGPGLSTTFIIQYIFDKGFNQMQYGYASAISTVVMIIFALIAFAQFKVNNGGET